MADPFDPQLCAIVAKAVGREGVLEGEGIKLHEKGTVICIGTSGSWARQKKDPMWEQGEIYDHRILACSFTFARSFFY